MLTCHHTGMLSACKAGGYEDNSDRRDFTAHWLPTRTDKLKNDVPIIRAPRPFLVANLVTTSKALVTTSVALVPSSFLLLVEMPFAPRRVLCS